MTTCARASARCSWRPPSRRPQPAQAALLRRHLGDPALDALGVDALREVIAETGALAHVEALISALTEQSLRALDSVEIAEPAHEVLHSLAVAATSRAF